MNINEKFEKLRALKPEKMDYSDRGTSELFTELFKDEIVYNTTMKEWYYYNTKFWEVDAGAMHISTLAKEFYDLLISYAVEIINVVERRIYLDYYKRLGSKTKRDILIRDAASNCYVSADRFDKNTRFFNCLNGTLDLQTFEFREHRAEDYITKISAVTYNPIAKSNLWNKFISEIMCGDIEKMRYLQKAVGYAISGDCNQEKMFILYGPSTRNGKSTFISTVSFLLGGTGGYAKNSSPQILEAQKSNRGAATEELARLAGCRMLSVSEPPQGMVLDAALVKILTGRDTITARFLYSNSFEFVPQFTLFINSNYLPEVTDDSLFKSDRIVVIEFTKHFTDAEQDKQLKSKLMTEESLSGILNWCLEGLKKFRIEGFDKPDVIIKSIDAYKEESDKVMKFFNDCLEPEDGFICTVKEVYELYKIWCIKNGYSVDGKHLFIEKLKNKELLYATGTVNGKTVRNVIKDYRLAA